MKETVLVTGGAGYIGSHTCKTLAKGGFLPVVYDSFTTGHRYAVKWGPLVEGDLRDTKKVIETLTTYRPKAVLHFAADALVAESVKDPAKYYQNNIGSTLSLLEGMREVGIPFLVFSSTCATYGNPQFLPITEEHPQLPINPYGRSKWMVEQILNDYAKAYGIQSIQLRYFNAAGADFETMIGENHTPETHLIPSVLLTALGVQEEVVVYGTDFPTKDGSAVRDYIHVQDLAEAHTLALKRLLSEKRGEAINLGTGKGYSVFEIIDAVEKFCDKKVRVRLEERRAGDPSILTCNATKAHDLLGWTPQWSELPLIIESAWKWHQLLLERGPVVKMTLERVLGG